MPGPEIKSQQTGTPGIFYNPYGDSDASPNSVWTQQPGFGTQTQPASGGGNNSVAPETKFKAAVNKIKQLAPNLKDEECLQLLCCYKSYTYEGMKKNPQTIDAATNHVIKTIQVLKNKRVSLSYNNIKQWALNYSVAIESGWDSIDSFEAAQSKNREGLTARIKHETQYNGGKDENAIEQFWNSAKNKIGIEGRNSIDISTLSDTAAVKEIINYLKRTFTTPANQLTDFSKLLINSNSRERQLLIAALKGLQAENVNSAWNGFLKIATNAERNQAIESMTPELMVELFNETGMDEQQVQVFTRSTTAHQNVSQQQRQREGINRMAQEMLTEENAKRYEDLKKQSPETWTKKDRAFIEDYERCLELQRGMRSGHIQGTLINEVNTKEENQAELNAMVADTQQYAGQQVYDDVIESTRGFIQEQQDEIAQETQVEMTSMMDEATQGEFSNNPSYQNNQVSNNNGGNYSNSNNSGGYSTSSSSTSPDSGGSGQGYMSYQPQQGSLGFEQYQAGQPQQTVTPRDLYPNASEQEQITLVKPQKGEGLGAILRNHTGNLSEIIDKHIKDNGVMGFVREALNCKGAMVIKYIRDKVLQLFNSMTTSLRINMFNGVFNNESASILISELDDGELNSVKAQNTYVKSQIDIAKKCRENKQETCLS